MYYLSVFLVLLVAIEHFYILIMEMFLWTKPRTLKVFGLEKTFAEQTKALAANQGLYNGFLAAGLIFGLLHSNHQFGLQIQVYFLVCVLAAAVFGSLTVKKSILLIQGLPALLALLSVFVLI